MVVRLSSRYSTDVTGGSLVLAPEKPFKSILSPIETKVLAAVNSRTSLRKLCERLDFEYPEREVLESIRSLLSKELIVVVCSAYPWGVEFDYLRREVALDELKREVEISAES